MIARRGKIFTDLFEHDDLCEIDGMQSGDGVYVGADGILRVR